MSVPIPELPAGFVQGLARHPTAMNVFGQLPAREKSHYIQRAHQTSSKAEMRALITELDHFYTP